MSIKLEISGLQLPRWVAYNRRDGWPGFAEIHNYKKMKFTKQTIFKRKTYDLNQLKIEKKHIKCAGNNPDLLKIFISNDDKPICKIDANSFEKKTGFNVDSILE